jgi:hypothetical protein
MNPPKQPGARANDRARPRPPGTGFAALDDPISVSAPLMVKMTNATG